MQVERRESRFGGTFEALPWPTFVWKLNVAGQSQMLHGELVAADAPAFIDFDNAGLAVFPLSPGANGANGASAPPSSL